MFINNLNFTLNSATIFPTIFIRLNLSSATIKNLPNDDIEHVVMRYEGIVKNNECSILPLVRVSLKKIENGKLLSSYMQCNIPLAELSTVRLGTIWKNQQKLEGHWKKYDRYDDDLYLNFNLSKQPASNVLLKKVDDKKYKLKPITYPYSAKDEGLACTMFVGRNGKRYIVQSIELLMSTYVPQNKLIRNDLLNYPIENVLQNYVLESEFTDDEYKIKFDKTYEHETMIFLAHLACNPKSQANISRLWSSLESDYNKVKKLPVLPYHSDKISFHASGVWLEDDLFYIQRINHPKPPDEVKYLFSVKSHVNELTDINTINQTQIVETNSVPINQNTVVENTEVTGSVRPGSTAGIKYIVSEVKPDNSDVTIEIVEDYVINHNPSSTSYGEKIDEVEGASSAKMSGSGESKKIARTQYIVEENPLRIPLIQEVEEALEYLLDEKIIDDLVYIDDNADEHENLVYASFSQEHIHLNGNKYWASGYIKGSGIKKANSGYRKMLIVKFTIAGKKPIYLLDLIRKNESDKFMGAVFQPEHTLSPELLDKIKVVVASNKGRFKADNLVPFPVKNASRMMHTWGKMDKRLKSVVNNILNDARFE